MTVSAVCSLPGQQALTAEEREQQITVDTIWKDSFISLQFQNVPLRVQSTYICECKQLSA